MRTFILFFFSFFYLVVLFLCFVATASRAEIRSEHIGLNVPQSWGHFRKLFLCSSAHCI